MPAGKTYIKIASQSASSSSSITFSNIPQNYTDLIMVINAQAGTSGEDFLMRFNGDTGNNYSNIWLRGLIAGTTSGQQEQTTSRIRLSDGGSSTTSNMSLINVNIQKYSAGIVKQVMSRANNAPRGLDMFGSRWNSTSAITSITILMSAGVISSGTFTLYGIECAKSPKATGGDKVYTTGTHWVHEFYNSGLFVPQVALTGVDYLVVAGGGGGGAYTGSGGGGAGGLRCTVTATGGGGSLESSLSLNANTGYTVTVGAGGSGEIYTNYSSNGSNSVFNNITSTGGGRGGGYIAGITFYPPNTGGSGGGGVYTGSFTSGAAGTANQGYGGGSGSAPNGQDAGGGGGGAGAVGGNGSTNGGNGGSGVQTAITGASVFYAGGGGGGKYFANSAGSGGSGGGGAGSREGANATSGTANTGGGGGGSGQTGIPATFSGGNGGSGIVIVRYPV